MIDLILLGRAHLPFLRWLHSRLLLKIGRVSAGELAGETHNTEELRTADKRAVQTTATHLSNDIVFLGKFFIAHRGGVFTLRSVFVIITIAAVTVSVLLHTVKIRHIHPISFGDGFESPLQELDGDVFDTASSLLPQLDRVSEFHHDIGEELDQPCLGAVICLVSELANGKNNLCRGDTWSVQVQERESSTHGIHAIPYLLPPLIALRLHGGGWVLKNGTTTSPTSLF